jgi:hypothetical protein
MRAARGTPLLAQRIGGYEELTDVPPELANLGIEDFQPANQSVQLVLEKLVEIGSHDAV